MEEVGVLQKISPDEQMEIDVQFSHLHHCTHLHPIQLMFLIFTLFALNVVIT
jgi:hypothetical protein